MHGQLYRLFLSVICSHQPCSAWLYHSFNACSGNLVCCAMYGMFLQLPFEGAAASEHTVWAAAAQLPFRTRRDEQQPEKQLYTISERSRSDDR
jgi:hypothetical protein